MKTDLIVCDDLTPPPKPKRWQLRRRYQAWRKHRRALSWFKKRFPGPREGVSISVSRQSEGRFLRTGEKPVKVHYIDAAACATCGGLTLDGHCAMCHGHREAF